MKLYISGPITGTENYLENFKKAEEHLKTLGYSVVNPAAVNSMLPEDTTYDEYMVMAMTMLEMCDGVVLLEGWQNSPGANREYGYAMGSDMKIFYLLAAADAEDQDIVVDRDGEILRNITAAAIHHKKQNTDSVDVWSGEESLPECVDAQEECSEECEEATAITTDETTDSAEEVADSADEETDEAGSADPEQTADEPEEDEGEVKKKRKTLDYGKIASLHNAGWSVGKIADEMNAKSGTISTVLWKLRKEGKLKDKRK